MIKNTSEKLLQDQHLQIGLWLLNIIQCHVWVLLKNRTNRSINVSKNHSYFIRKLLLSEKNKFLFYLPRGPLGFTPAPLPVREFRFVAFLMGQPPLWSFRKRWWITACALLALTGPWPIRRGACGAWPSPPRGAPGAVSQCREQEPGAGGVAASARPQLLAVRAHQVVVGCGFTIAAVVGRVLLGYPVDSIALLEW